MGIGTGSAALIGGLGAASSLGGAAISSSAAGNAASTQAAAAEQAAQLQYQAEQQALGFQEQVWGQQQQNLAPWLQSGVGALGTLDQLMGLNAPNVPANYGQPQTPNATAPSPYGNRPIPQTGATGPMGTAQQNLAQNYALRNGQFSTGQPINAGTFASGPNGAPPVRGTAQGPASTLPQGVAPGIRNGQLQPFAPWTQQFQAPTNVTEQNDPGYQFRLQQGEQALQNSAAARGDLLSGNTLAGITQYGQDYASNEYQNVYNRAFNQYSTAYNQFQQNQANQYNRLANLAGLGQTSVGQLGMLGSNAASGVGNTLLGSAGQIGQSLQNAGAATASGYASQGNIWGGALGNLGNLGMMAALYNQNQPNVTSGIDLGSAPSQLSSLTNPAYYGTDLGGGYNSTAWGG